MADSPTRWLPAPVVSRSPRRWRSMYSLLRTFRWSSMLAVVAAALTVVAASAARDRQTHLASASTMVKPATARQWKALIAKAKREGSVNFYTSHNPVDVANLAQK